MSENYGHKKGFNNNSGLIYIYQGLTNTEGNKPIFPFSKVYQPYFKNDERTKKILDYMRSGDRPVIKEKKPIIIAEELKIQGGDVRDQDLNNI